ncbi:MAG: hypothetical protein JNN18_13750 [Rubrivivax sp.]|nr:hypothetical protein [Rubrivivax sp.]
MKSVAIRWGAVAGALLLAEAVLVGAAFAWVAIYSHLLNPGQPIAIYQGHAQASGPWVSILVGMPLFAAIGCRLPGPPATAWAFIAAYLVLDAAVLLAAAGAALPAGLVVASYASKGLALVAGRRCQRARRPAAAGA